MLAENIKRFREAKGISKEEFADRMGVSGVTVGYWESGRSEPRMGKVEGIAAVLDVTIDELLFSQADQKDLMSRIHNETNADRLKAIELIMSLPEEEVKMFRLLMERSIEKG